MITVKTHRLARKLVSAFCALTLAAGLAPGALAAQSFSDVREGQWFKPFTDKIVDAGMMNGMGDGTFAPDGHLTLAQAAVLAYQVHSRNYNKSLPQASGAWYMPYYQYCLDNGIFTADQVPLSAIDRDATRYEMVTILDKAVPDDQMKAINTLPDGYVPDLSEGGDYGSTVYKWYRAGTLTGDNSHRFNGGNSITRAEVSVILCQLTNLVERTKLDPAQTAVPKPVTKVTVSIPKTTLAVKDTTTATVTVAPSDAADKSVIWSSSNSGVASVSSSGRITALSAGSATITATASNGVKGSASVTVTASASSQDPKALIDEVVRLTNVERAKEGLPALETFDTLDQAAAIRAPEIVTLFSHTRPDGSSCFTALDKTGASQGAYTYGENIAAGNSTAAATVEQWMNSPGHRANILNKDYTHIGVGYATGGQYRCYWVQMFVGRPATAGEKPVTKVTVSIPQNTLAVNGTTTATAAVAPSNAIDKTVTWSSSNSKVASVSSSGQITALSAGTATITATASNGVKGSLTITVTASEKPVTKVTIQIPKTALTVKDTTVATAVITPSDAADKTVAWTSSDSGVASINSNGQITALSAGTATITATAGNGVKGTAVITVAAPAAQDPKALIDEVVRLTNVERAKEGLPALETFDALDRAAAIRAPEAVTLFSHTRPDGSSCFTALDETGASRGAYTYGENIAAGNSTAAATVEQWMNSPGHRANILNKDYTHIGVGYATGGQYRYCWVQMFVGRPGGTSTPTTPAQKEVASISLRAGKTELTVGGTTTVSSTVAPSDAADKSVSWASSDDSVASINSSGRVTALSAGTATITATASNGVSGKITITVSEPANKDDGREPGTDAGNNENAQLPLRVSRSIETISTGSSLRLSAYTEDADGALRSINAGLEWTNESPELLSLRNGIVSSKGQQTGTGYVTAHYNGQSQRVTVRVVRLEDKIDLSCLALSMDDDSYGTTALYVFSSSKFYGQDYDVSWSVDDPSILSLEERDVDGNPGVRFTSKQSGNARITCRVTMADGSQAEEYCFVHVK